jgi:hypothetical protein
MKPYLFQDLKKSPYWQYRIYEDSKIVEQKSTGTENKDEAWKMAMIGTLAYGVAADKRRPKTRLRRTLMELYRIATKDEWAIYTIREYLADWRSSRRIFVGGSTNANQQRAVQLFEDYMAEPSEPVQDKLDWLLDDLKPMHIRGWANWLVTTGQHTPASANARLEVLSNVMNRAVDDGVIPDNPARGIELKIRTSTKTNQEESYYPYRYHHVLAMIEKGIAPGVNPEMAITSLVALDLGGRTGDMFGLIRDNFNLADNLVEYNIRKVVKIHGVILFPSTVALLQKYFDYHLLDKLQSAPLAPTFYVKNDDTVDDDDFRSDSSKASDRYGDFLTATGVRPLSPPRITNGHADWDHSFHSARPTVSTALKLAGVKAEAVMARMPHESEEVNKKYNRFNIQSVCRAVFEGVGLVVPEAQKNTSNVTMKEIFELMEMARQKLISLRGKLDLHDGTIKHGMISWRAQLVPISRQMPQKTLHALARKAAAEEAKKKGEDLQKTPVDTQAQPAK